VKMTFKFFAQLFNKSQEKTYKPNLNKFLGTELIRNEAVKRSVLSLDLLRAALNV
jgi:hypothetical protein